MAGLIVCLILSGCWDRKELNQLAVITGLGVDFDVDRRKIQISAEVIIPSKMQGSQGDGGGSGGEQAVFLAKGEGDTVFQAIRRTAFTTTRKLNLTHNEVIILSDTIARQGISPVLDVFIRDPEPRPTQWVLISEAKPDAIFKVKPKLEKATAMMITDLMHNAGTTSEVYPVNLQRAITMLLSKTTAATFPMIKAIGEQEQKKLQVAGLAVFKQDRMVGKLNPDQTRGLLWVINQVQSGIVVVDLSEDQRVSMEIIEASGAIEPRLINGQPEVDLRIKVLCNLGDQMKTGETGDRSMAGQFRILEKKLAQAIDKEIQTTLTQTRKLQTDIFGFGEKFYLKYPKQWETLEPDWDRLFTGLKVNIQVNAGVRLEGETLRSLTAF